MKKVIIIGAGGHAKVLADIVLSNNDKLLGFLDDNYKEDIFGYKILGTIADVNKFSLEDVYFAIGIGNDEFRYTFIQNNSNIKYYTAIHPSAIISRFTVINEGSQLMANTVINSCANIGKHCIINTGSIVEHDSIIEDYVHIEQNVVVAGNCVIKSRKHIELGTKIKRNTVM